MRRIRLVLAYDGTNYSGWQFQNNAVTIEEVLNKALSQLLGEKIAVIGASRTDAGVHALQNVAVFDTENPMAADKICLALNQWLPEDIRALSSEAVPMDWHPRKQNCTKTYEYRILNRKINMPTERLYSYFCYFPLDVEKMRQAAAYLLGEHDFRSFCTRRGQEEESVRTIYSLDIDKTGDMITIRISGSGFLYNMVRIIAGTLMKVGIGVYPPEHMEEILDARDRRAAGPTAPAKGLTLVSMEYETRLQERIVGENKDWSYELVQREIAEWGRAYLIIRRCTDRDFDRLLLRVTHQAMRNGAREVYVCDAQPEAEGRCGTAEPEETGRGTEPQETGRRTANPQETGRRTANPQETGRRPANPQETERGTADGREPDGKAVRSRIVEGRAYGHYTFYHIFDVFRTEKNPKPSFMLSKGTEPPVAAAAEAHGIQGTEPPGPAFAEAHGIQGAEPPGPAAAEALRLCEEMGPRRKNEAFSWYRWRWE